MFGYRFLAGRGIQPSTSVGDFNITLSGVGLAGSLVRIYYVGASPLASGSDLTGYPVTQYSHGVDYDNTTPLSFTALFTANGGGYYVIGVIETTDTTKFWNSVTGNITSSDPPGLATNSSLFMEDSSIPYTSGVVFQVYLDSTNTALEYAITIDAAGGGS